MGMAGVLSGVFVALLIIFIFNIQPARANMKSLEALKYLSYQPEVGMELMKVSLAFNSPHIDDIRADLSRTVGQVLSDQTNTKFSKEKRLELFSLAHDALVANTQLHPYDIRNYLTLSQLGQIGYSLTGNTQYIAEYAENLERALSYSPKRQQIIYNIANFYLQTGRQNEALKLLEDTLQDGPMVAENYWRLAYLYKLIGKMDKAKETIDLAKKNGVIFDQPQQSIVDQILSPAPLK